MRISISRPLFSTLVALFSFPKCYDCPIARTRRFIVGFVLLARFALTSCSRLFTSGLLKAVPGPCFGVLGQGGRAHHRTKNVRRRQPHMGEGNAQGESEEDLDEHSADENDDDDEDEHNLGYIWDDEEGGSEAEEVDEATAAAEEAAAAEGVGTELASPLRREAVSQQDILCEDDGGVSLDENVGRLRAMPCPVTSYTSPHLCGP